jgi:PAS domain S-box-containing protein
MIEVKDITRSKSEVVPDIPGEFFDSIADPVYIKDSNLNYLYVNQAYCRMIGFEYKNISGKSDYDFLAKAEADISRQLDIVAFGSMKELVREERLTTSQGEMCIVSSKRKIYTDKKTGLKLLICVLRDITEYKSYEKKLKIYKSRLQEMVDERTVELMNLNVSLGIENAEKQATQEQLHEAVQIFELVINNIEQYVFWKDANLRYLGCNKLYAEAAGLNSPEDIRGKSDFELKWDRDDILNFQKTDLHIIESNIPIKKMVETFSTANGTQMWVETTKVPLRDINGNVIGILGSYHDITESKRYEDDIAKSEKKYRSVFELSPEIICLIDTNGIIVDINNRIKDWVGIEPSKISGQKVIGMEILSLESRNVIARNLKKHLLGTNYLSYEIELLVSEEKMLYGVVVSAPVFDNKGAIQYILAIISDITDRKIAEDKMKNISKDLERMVIDRTAQLQKALTELEEENKVRKITELKLLTAKDELSKALDKEKELNELKNRFISMISHEYRTPLTVILTSTYIIEQLYETKSKEEFRKFLDKIRNSVETMTQLHDNVLTFGRSEAGVIAHSRETINLVSFMENLIEEIKIVDNNNHLIILNHKLEDFIVNSDSKLLRHIFNNIIINATKYSNPGTHIFVDMNRENNHITIKVRDKGFGIAADDIARLFEPFHRGKNIAAKSGTGLGLAIVQKSVEQLNGEITVESTLNIGSEFTVNLPAR